MKKTGDGRKTKRRLTFVCDDEGEIAHELLCYRHTDPFDLTGAKSSASSSSSLCGSPPRVRCPYSMASVTGEPTDTACCGLRDWLLDDAEPGYLWILYQRAMDMTGIVSVANWQRRDFRWKDLPDEFSLTCASGTLQGQSRMACILASEAGNATIQPMTPVVLESPTDELRAECVSAMLDYETERGFSQYAGQEELFEKQVPHTLWPFFIKWTDKDGKQKHKILASAQGYRHQLKVLSKINRTIREHSRARGPPSCVSGLLMSLRGQLALKHA